MGHAGDISSLLAGDGRRMRALAAVRALGLPDCWIAAGFVRDAVWDRLHGRTAALPGGDVDVVWFDPADAAADYDAALESRLNASVPELDWSVKNQARMHSRNGDRPYRSVADAMTFWPETATAVAVRLDAAGIVEINAPLGLDDLYGLRLVPTPGFAVRKRAVFDERIRAKRWLERYPLLSPP